MPFSALPPDLNPKLNPLAWRGTDHDSWLIHWKVKVIGWFAYGPRATEWWARWRKLPKTLLAIFGPGESRWEESEGRMAIRALNSTVIWYQPTIFYLSRIQYWCDWSIQLQWPLFLCCSYKLKSKVLFFYIGAKRDGDCYWFPSIFIGLGWK